MTDSAVRTELPHGWYGTYTNHGCRCERCKEAWRDYRRATRGTGGIATDD